MQVRTVLGLPVFYKTFTTLSVQIPGRRILFFINLGLPRA